MVIIMCSWCNHIGSSTGKYRDFLEEVDNVIEHESTCEEKKLTG